MFGIFLTLASSMHATVDVEQKSRKKHSNSTLHHYFTTNL